MFWFFFKRIYKIHKPLLISMSRISFYILNPCIYSNFFSKYFYLLCSIYNTISKCSWCLISNKQNCTIWFP